MLDHALQYAARGWPVFRVTGFKTPLKGSHGHLDATTDPETIRRWWNERPKANIALACGELVVLDLDGGQEAFASPRGAALKALAAGHGGLPRTLTSQTARGAHLIYRAPAGVTIRSSNEPRDSKGAPGVDIKGHGGWIVLPPSINAKSGFEYRWALDVPIAPLPDWLIEWLQGLGAISSTSATTLGLGAKPDYLKQKQQHVAQRASKTLSAPYNISEHQRLSSALATIPANHYDTWIEVGLALHSLDWERSDGTSIGFDLWDRWSATCPDKYNPVGMAEKWASFGRTGRSKITVATIYHHAGKHGWQPPAPRAVNPEQEVMQHTVVDRHEHKTQPHSLSAVAAGGAPYMNGHALPAELTAIPPSSESPLIKLNETYSVIGDLGGKCMVMGWVASKVDPAVHVPSFQTFKSFAERFSHQYCESKKLKNGQWVDEPQQLGAAWLKWPRRISYEGIDLVPDAPPILPNGYYNLWKGYSVEPRAGAWPLMRNHIAKVLANHDIVSLEYIIKWAAWKLQHPGEPTEAALVFKGAKGAGKGTFARVLRQLFGQHGLQIFNSKHLVGSFNGHLRNCLLLYADEAFWAGDKQGESTLKGLITEPTIPIEQKGIDVVDWKNRIGMVMTTNAEWVVPASHDERRYAVFQVSEDHIRDENYFKALRQELDNGGMEAMLHDLLKVELKDWHPRRIPQTEALQQQKLRSLDPRYEWFEDMLQNGLLPTGSAESYVVPSYVVNNMARDSAPRLREMSMTAIGRFLGEQGCEKVHNAKANGWRFDPLTVHRLRWEKRFGNWKWSYKGEDWIRK